MHGDYGVFRYPQSGTTDFNAVCSFHCVDDVITRYRVNRNTVLRGINLESISAGRRVTGFIRHADIEGLGTVGQRDHIGRRNNHTPVAAGLNRGFIGIAVERNRDNLPGFDAGCGTAQHLRRLDFRAVNGVIAAKCIH